jgi:putative flippase GtrA
MVVIPIFGGLLAAVLSFFWPSKIGILPRFLMTALSASATAMLFALIVYFLEARWLFRRKTQILHEIINRMHKKQKY